MITMVNDDVALALQSYWKPTRYHLLHTTRYCNKMLQTRQPSSKNELICINNLKRNSLIGELSSTLYIIQAAKWYIHEADKNMILSLTQGQSRNQPDSDDQCNEATEKTNTILC